jgi:hypothetical protein
MYETAAGGVDRYYRESGKTMEQRQKTFGRCGLAGLDNDGVCTGLVDLRKEVLAASVTHHHKVRRMNKRCRDNAGEHIRHSDKQDAHVLRSPFVNVAVCHGRHERA